MVIAANPVEANRAGARKAHGIMAFALAMVIALLMAEPVAAQAVGGLQKLQTAAEKIVQFFTGPFGRSVGAIALIGLFLAAAFGYWSWGALLRVGGSIVCIFAVVELVNFLAA